MPDCHKIDRMLSRLIDGETTASEEELVRKHLSVCAECEERFRSFQKESFLLQQFYDETPVPDGIADQVLARVLEAPRDDEETAWHLDFPLLRRFPVLEPGRAATRLKWLSAVAALLFVTFLVQWARRTDVPESSIGFISYVRPPVMRQLPGSETWSELSGSGFLLPGGALQAWDGGMVQVDCVGRGNVLLNSRSAFTLEEPVKGHTVMGLLQGELFVEFIRAKASFVLRTPAGEVAGRNAAVNVKILAAPGASVSLLRMGPCQTEWRERLGPAAFNLLPCAYARASGVEVIVTTKTGVVEVRNERGSARAYAGTQVSVTPGAPPGRQEPANLGLALQWTKRRRQEVALRELTEGASSVASVAIPEPQPDERASRDLAGSAAASLRAGAGVVRDRAPDFPPEQLGLKPLRLFPPVIVEATPEVGRIVLNWVDDGATTYEPVGYNVYRMRLDPVSGTKRLNATPVSVIKQEDGSTAGTFVDPSVVGDARYAYHVRTLADPPPSALPRAGLLESPASAPREVKARRDFILTLTGWSGKPEQMAHILVQKWHRGRPLGHVFQVRIGDSIGRALDLRMRGLGSQPIIETVDFSTGCTLVDLRRDRRVVPGGIVPGQVSKPLTLPTQIAVILGPEGETIELPRQP